MKNKWNFDIEEETNNIYRNLCSQINKVFKHKTLLMRKITINNV